MVAISKQANYKHCGLHSVTWINAICIVIDWHEISNTGTIRRVYRCISGTKSYEFRSCPISVHEQTTLKLMALIGFLPSY